MRESLDKKRKLSGRAIVGSRRLGRKTISETIKHNWNHEGRKKRRVRQAGRPMRTQIPYTQTRHFGPQTPLILVTTQIRMAKLWKAKRRHSTAQHSTAQHSTAQHSTAQHSTAQHSTAQHSTAQHSTAQHSTAQHSTAQHSTAQHSTAQHSTAQHSTAQHSKGEM